MASLGSPDHDAMALLDLAGPADLGEAAGVISGARALPAQPDTALRG